MKSFSSTLISLSFIGAGAYYIYTTNQDARTFVSDLLHSNRKPTSDSLIVSAAAPVDTTLQIRSRTPKKILPDNFSEIDAYAKKALKLYEKDIQTLADYLIKPANSDAEKARVLYTWVATNITYDDVAFNSGNYPDYSAINVLRHKKAVCEGYANILKALCDAAGLECEKIIGYSKGYSYKPGESFKETNHAWNAIKVNNAWQLFDATWGSTFGTAVNGKLVSTSRFDPYWFNVPPKAFIFTHLPENSSWQFTENTLSLRAYEKLPYIHGSFFKLGFNSADIFSEAISGKTKAFVETYSPDYPIHCSKLPYTQTIRADKEIVFEIESDYAEKVALIDGKSWHYFTKEGNAFTLQHKPIGKEVKICVKINWFDKNFSTIAKYKVIQTGVSM